MNKTFRFIIQKIKDGALKDKWAQTRWVYEYACRYWKSMTIYTIIGLAGTITGLSASLVSKNLVDIITGHKTGLLIKCFCMFIGLSVFNIILTQLSTYASNLISTKVDNEIKSDIFNKMLITDWESITKYHTGDLLTRWSSDASNISSGILNWIPNLLIYTVKFICALGIVVYYDPTFAFFALLGMPVTFFMSKNLLNRMQQNNNKSAAMNAKMASFNQESFSNIQTLKAFNLISLYSSKLKSLQKEYLDMKMDFQKMSLITAVIMSLVGIVVSYSCYGWGIYRVWSGAISYGTMTMFLSLSSTLTSTFNSLVSLVPTAISITTSAGRLMDIIDMPQEDYSDADKIDKLYELYKNEGISLKINNLDYSYHNGTNVFKDTSIEAHPHEIIALVGPSGEGKTTMLRIILSILRPVSGNCFVYGGDDLSSAISFSPAARKLFSYVPQGNTMFSGTIAENMRNVKPDATDEEIINVLKAACAYDFVESLPDGINSKIGERGGGFSEGQSQRLSIARSLLRKSPVLLLDEATSALDVATERKVLRNIMNDDYPRTCIVATHRPTVLTMCDRVYSIQNKNCVILNNNKIDELISEF